MFTDLREPNIRTFLAENKLDLIINVLTGDNDYDESSDSNLIRSLAIENGTPLITDVDVAILTIENIIQRVKEALLQFGEGAVPKDDVSIMIVEYVGE